MKSGESINSMTLNLGKTVYSKNPSTGNFYATIPIIGKPPNGVISVNWKPEKSTKILEIENKQPLLIIENKKLSLTENKPLLLTENKPSLLIENKFKYNDNVEWTSNNGKTFIGKINRNPNTKITYVNYGNTKKYLVYNVKYKNNNTAPKNVPSSINESKLQKQNNPIIKLNKNIKITWTSNHKNIKNIITYISTVDKKKKINGVEKYYILPLKTKASRNGKNLSITEYEPELPKTINVSKVTIINESKNFPKKINIGSSVNFQLDNGTKYKGKIISKNNTKYIIRENKSNTVHKVSENKVTESKNSKENSSLSANQSNVILKQGTKVKWITNGEPYTGNILRLNGNIYIIKDAKNKSGKPSGIGGLKRIAKNKIKLNTNNVSKVESVNPNVVNSTVKTENVPAKEFKKNNIVQWNKNSVSYTGKINGKKNNKDYHIVDIKNSTGKASSNEYVSPNKLSVKQISNIN